MAWLKWRTATHHREDIMATTERQEQNQNPRKRAGVAEIDPVCGMKVEGNNPDLSVKYEGKQYRFCSQICQDRFRSDPEQFAI
jgi:Cu+-exporting ATPase